MKDMFLNVFHLIFYLSELHHLKKVREKTKNKIELTKNQIENLKRKYVFRMFNLQHDLENVEHKIKVLKGEDDGI